VPDSQIIPSSVISLLDQSTAAAEVPDPSAFVTTRWLAGVTLATGGLIDAALERPEHNAIRSFRGNGQEVLLLARDETSGCNVYLRRHADGAVAPVVAHQKTVTMTLSGTASLEAYRDEGDVENDEPWYVRDFDSESLYACHPGTIHRLDLSPDAYQLVLSREDLELDGSAPLESAEYLAALTAAQPALAMISRQSLAAEVADSSA